MAPRQRHNKQDPAVSGDDASSIGSDDVSRTIRHATDAVKSSLKNFDEFKDYDVSGDEIDPSKVKNALKPEKESLNEHGSGRASRGRRTKDSYATVRRRPSLIRVLQSKNSEASLDYVTQKVSAARLLDEPKFIVKFEPRASPLDWSTLIEQKNIFRGFVTFLWVYMAFTGLYSLYNLWNTVEDRSGINFSLYRDLFNPNNVSLFFSDMAMIASLYYCVVFQKLVYLGFIPRFLITPIYATLEISWFCGWNYYGLFFDWSWTQLGFFTLHTISMLMKQHSYHSYNNQMHSSYIEVQKIEDVIDIVESHIASSEGKDAYIEKLEKVIEEAQDAIDVISRDIQSTTVCYPNNITAWNFTDYLLVPTLVYALEYPRTKERRYLYLLEKFIAVVGTFGLLYIIVEHSIMPVLWRVNEHSFVDTVVSLIVPFMISYMLIFYIMFEGVCNWFAELTCFADRQFYEDWWNSASFDEYARKWNKPVHEFLLRHIYFQSIRTYKVSKTSATLITFFLSSVLHEFVMLMIGKRLRMYLFLMQMFQIPLIIMAKMLKMDKNWAFGNAFYWIGMSVGPPMLAIAYCREHYHIDEALN